MNNVIRNTARAVITVEQVILKAIYSALSVNTSSKPQCCDKNKYFIDKNGSMIVNKSNPEVQASFDKNLNGLSSKKAGK